MGITPEHDEVVRDLMAIQERLRRGPRVPQMPLLPIDDMLKVIDGDVVFFAEAEPRPKR